MSEIPIPTKDIKTSIKVVSTVGGKVFEELNPSLKRSAIKNGENILKTILRKK